MNIKISLDNLDSAIRKLEQLKGKIQSFPVDVAEEARLEVGYNDVSVKHAAESHTIIASDEGIAFKEFGAGYVADYEVGFQEWGGDDFHSEPGVWSAENARTFQKHQASGQQPSTYKYNKVPENKMQRTAQRLHAETAQKAKEYFK